MAYKQQNGPNIATLVKLHENKKIRFNLVYFLKKLSTRIFLSNIKNVFF
jgi:hypothetical protein